MRLSRRLLLTSVSSFLLFAVASLGTGARAADGAVTLRIASVAPEGTPWSSGIQQFKKQVEGATANKLAVKPFLSGVLGDENETALACQRGQIQGVAASTGALASIVPELAILELPYLFRNAAEADYILDTVILADIEKAFKAKGLVLGFWSENGYRSFGTNFGPVKSPAALKGHKMRSQESPVHLAMYRAFGASPVPIPVTEVLTSMQTGVIDGYDNTALFAMAAQWTTVTKHYTLTDHIYQPAAIVYNKAWFEALPADQQKTLLNARTNLAPQMRKEIRALNPILIQNLGEMGVTVHTLTAAERASFDALAKSARDTYLAKATPAEKALYTKITGALATYRKSHP
jgi:tripartite ATP-independent transporter DctP family solute receptor